MPTRVVMPKLSDTMEEGRILRWLRKEGDRIEAGQPLAEVETDKATVEMEAYSTGILRKLVAGEGETVNVGALIAVLGTADEDISALLAEAMGVPAAAPAAASPAVGQPAVHPSPAAPPTGDRPPEAAAAPAAPLTPPVAATASRRSVKASPLALRMAAESGLDLGPIVGTGPQGRIIKRDVEAVLAAARPPAPAGPAGVSVERAGRARAAAPRDDSAEVTAVDLSMMRRTIAKRLVQSKSPVPHFYLTVDVAMDRTWEAWRALREDQSAVSLNDVIIKVTAAALRRHPEMNASFGGDHVKRYARVHVGVAVAVEDGLITPVVRDADAKTIEEIAAETRALIERARARQLQPDEYTGATFSVSNLGMYGIEEFSAIINPPEAAILAVGAVREVPVVEDGGIRAGRRMKLTLSVDHRVADGAMAARFLQTLRRLLENPLLLA